MSFNGMDHDDKPTRVYPVEVPIPVITIPRWLIIQLLGLLVLVASIIYNTGQITARLSVIESRFDKMENRFNDVVDKLIREK